MTASNQLFLADMRRSNLRAAVDAVLVDGAEVSLADLVAATRLSRPTIAQSMKAMADRGLVTSEFVRPPSGIGRPMLRYRPVSSHYSVAALRFGTTAVELALADPFGDVYAVTQMPTVREGSDAWLHETIGDFLAQTRGELQAVVVAAMGIVHHGKVVRSDRHPELEDDRFVSGLSSVFAHHSPDADVRVANDAKLASKYLYERLLSEQIESSYAVVVHISDVFGCGIVVNGEVLDGAHGAAGEVGIVQDGPWAQAYGVLNEAMTTHHLSSGQLYEKVHEGMPALSGVGREIAANVARGISPLLLAFDPDSLIIGGEVATIGDLLEESIRGHLAQLGVDPPDIHVLTDSDDAVIRGAILTATDAARDRIAASLMSYD